MAVMTAATAKADFFSVMERASNFHEPITISGERNNVVLISEEDWNAIQETLYLTSIPNMRESIIKGMKEPLSESVENCACSANVDAL